ncbi:hypothetical protein F5050DRAFT_1812912 [Lentinula boryana]|uniref:Uncharacterized protein n=1 Tax=Lentinula boryana TaxID=40481 RepID=A0ABQ8PY45_9AGAR|nr:hypothetical protein F5050DRAFT_1812912 [Lentinula boryana]
MELSTLVAKFSRNIVNGRLEEKKDWEKRLLRLIFEYDLKVCLGEDLPSSAKLNFNNFLAKAWMFKVRVVDWSSSKFPKHNIQRVGDLSTNDLPHTKEFPSSWSISQMATHSDEHALAEEDMGDIALVVGINNQTLVSVSDVQSWQAAVGGSSATKKGRGTNSGQRTLSLYASDSEDETAAYNERLKKALARRPPPPPQAHHPPAPSLPSQVEVLSRHPPLPPPHSHPSILAWRVPPPSLHMQCSPPSHPHPHPLPRPHPHPHPLPRPHPRPLPHPLSQPPKESAGLKRKRDEGTVDDEKGTDGLATRKKHDARGR